MAMGIRLYAPTGAVYVWGQNYEWYLPHNLILLVLTGMGIVCALSCPGPFPHFKISFQWTP